MYPLLLALLIHLEHAKTPEELRVGLMGRKELTEDSGMLFHLPYQDCWGFWSYDCLIPLTLAFLDKDGTIMELADLQAFPDVTTHYPKEPCSYVLEMPKGWFLHHNVRIGDQIAWDLEGSHATVIFRR